MDSKKVIGDILLTASKVLESHDRQRFKGIKYLKEKEDMKSFSFN